MIILKRPFSALFLAAAALILGIIFFFFYPAIAITLLLVAGLLIFSLVREYKRFFTLQMCDKQKHTFTEQQTSQSRLWYEGDLPILMIGTADPKEKGRLLGQHTGVNFLSLWDRYFLFITYAMRYIRRDYFSNPLAFIRKEMERLQLQMPPFLLAEMEGFLEALKKPFPLDDLKAMFVFGDIYKGLSGCSAAVRPFELMRNFDWYSMGLLGESTLLILCPVRQPRQGGPKKVLSITFPPCLFSPSLANDSGFVVIINEATKMATKRNISGGYPQLLLLRELAEHCTTVEEALDFISRHPPAASHLVAMMDKTGDGAVVQMLPTGSEELFTVRRLTDSFILMTNHYLDDNGNMIRGSEAIASSEPRFLAMEKALMEHKPPREVLAAANCLVTMHSMIFRHQEGQFLLDFNYDNFYAGSINNKFTSLNLTKLFSTANINDL